jgi:protease I
VSLQVAEPDEDRNQWRVARFHAADPEELVIALGEHVPNTYRAVAVHDVHSVVPLDFHDWIDIVCARQRALADGFGRHDPRVAPNEEHVRAASTRFAELAGDKASKLRALEELENAIVDVPDTVGELLGRATRQARGAENLAAGAPADRTTITAHADAMFELLAAACVERELPGSEEHSYLDGVIAKPWGCEFRVYDDALTDVWLLQMKAGTQTSMHCHARKDTIMVCLEGEGALVADGDRRISIAQGSVIHIQQGAVHCALARSGMTLVEVETPRDRFDHLRLKDVSGRAGQAYESAAHVERQLDPLEDVGNGPPRARLRPSTATGRYRFRLERGIDLDREVEGLICAISLDQDGILRREITIVRPEALTAILPEHTYLTIRATAVPVPSRENALAPHEAIRWAGVEQDRRRGRELCELPSAEGHVNPRTTHAVIVTGPAFQGGDVIYAYHRMMEAGFDVEVATADGEPITGNNGVTAPLDMPAKPCIAFKNLDVDEFDLVLLMLAGHEAPTSARPARHVLEFVRDMDAAGKLVASLCHGSWALPSADIMYGRRVCSDAGIRDDMSGAGAEVNDADVIFVDRNIISCSHHSAVAPFMTTVIALCEDHSLVASSASPVLSLPPGQVLPSDQSSPTPRAVRSNPTGACRARHRRFRTRGLRRGGIALFMTIALLAGLLSHAMSRSWLLRGNDSAAPLSLQAPDPRALTPTNAAWWESAQKSRRAAQEKSRRAAQEKSRRVAQALAAAMCQMSSQAGSTSGTLSAGKYSSQSDAISSKILERGSSSTCAMTPQPDIASSTVKADVYASTSTITCIDDDDVALAGDAAQPAASSLATFKPDAPGSSSTCTMSTRP